MIWNVLEALTAFFILVKGIKYYKKLQNTFLKLKQTSISNVSELHELFKNKKSLQKIFAIVKGIAKAQSKSGQNDILSIIKTKELRQKPIILNEFEKVEWSKIMDKPYWTKPRELKNLKFGLKDLVSDQVVSVQNCHKSNISGALSEIFSQKIVYPTSKNPFIKFLRYIYNLFSSIIPFKYIFNKIKYGDDIKYFGILDGQFLLAIGEIEKDMHGELVMKNPNYLTKQKAFIEENLKKKMNYLYWTILLIMCIKIYALYQIGKKVIKMHWKKGSPESIDEQEQKRSQEEGEFANCVICYTNVRSVVLKPCRHYGFCNDCYSSFKHKGCPICKIEIRGVIRIIKKKD